MENVSQNGGDENYSDRGRRVEFKRKEGRVQEAIALFESMTSEGFPPNKVTFNTLLDCLCKSDEVDLALKMLYGMKKMNCIPDVFTYNTIIYGLAKDNRVSVAFWLFHQMRKVLHPDYVTLCTLLPSVVKDGRTVLSLLLSLSLYASISVFESLSLLIFVGEWVYLNEGDG